MKKSLFILFIGLFSAILFPFNINAKSISTLDVTNNNGKLTVSGTTENGVLAVAVWVYSGEDLNHMETCSSNGDEYSCELSKKFETGNYTVKVADYNGGDYISKDISISVSENNPQTSDNIINTVIICGLSLLGIISCIFFFKKKVIINK